MLIVGETMVPMVAAIVREIDIAARRIVIDPPAGLFDASRWRQYTSRSWGWAVA